MLMGVYVASYELVCMLDVSSSYTQISRHWPQTTRNLKGEERATWSVTIPSWSWGALLYRESKCGGESQLCGMLVIVFVVETCRR